MKVVALLGFFLKLQRLLKMLYDDARIPILPQYKENNGILLHTEWDNFAFWSTNPETLKLQKHLVFFLQKILSQHLSKY